MDAAAALRSPPSPLYFSRAPDFSRRDLLSFDPKPHFPARSIKGWGSISVLKRSQRPFGPCRRSAIRVSASLSSSSSSSGNSSSSQIAPLRFESPIGQFLSQMLVTHPHLLPAAIEQQLEQLQTDREAEKKNEEPTPSGTELVLYRRIAEVKDKERKRALEEILYTLVVQKFVEADVSLVPALCQSGDPSKNVDQWVPKEEKFEKLHSSEAYEMIKNHLGLILGQRVADPSSVAPISKLRVGQVYAASVMYGYFLKRVDERFQLEKSMKTLPWASEEEENENKQEMPFIESSHPEMEGLSFTAGGPSKYFKPSPLRSYVMLFDSGTLQRYATIRSKEAFSIIEKQTEALFGRPEVVITPQGTIDSSKDETIKISFAGLRRLILEAVTFGSFLWDVESFVDSRYHFVTN